MVLLKRLSVISISLLTTVSFMTAAESVVIKQSSKVEMKCHVELMGGHNVVHFTVIKKRKVAKLNQFLVGRKILTDLSKKKKVIYKVKECINSKDSFKSLTARQIEKNMAR